MSYWLTWSGRSLWAILVPTTRGQYQIFSSCSSFCAVVDAKDAKNDTLKMLKVSTFTKITTFVLHANMLVRRERTVRIFMLRHVTVGENFRFRLQDDVQTYFPARLRRVWSLQDVNKLPGFKAARKETKRGFAGQKTWCVEEVSHELLCETQQCEEETSFYTVDKHRSSTVSNKNLHFKQSHDIL